MFNFLININSRNGIDFFCLLRKGWIYGKSNNTRNWDWRIFKEKDIFNKREIEKATKHLNDEMDETAEEFYKTKKDKEKDDDLSL